MQRSFGGVILLTIGLVTIALGTGTPSRGDDQQDFRPLFNGKDLDGWVASRPELWGVQDGMIIGKLEKKGQIKKNTFLATKENFSDFILKASARLVKDEGNSGIQLRSKILPDGTAKGYQADIAKGYWGLLLEEGGRGILKRPEPKAVKNVKHDGWNHYVITAKGHHIKLELNGITSVDFEDAKGDLSGVIAFQLHVGPAMEVQFKDIEVKELK